MLTKNAEASAINKNHDDQNLARRYSSMPKFRCYYLIFTIASFIQQSVADPTLFWDTRLNRETSPAEILAGEMYRYIPMSDKELLARYKTWLTKQGTEANKNYQSWADEYKNYELEQQQKIQLEIIDGIKNTTARDLQKDPVKRKKLIKQLSSEDSLVRKATIERLSHGALGDDLTTIAELLKVSAKMPGGPEQIHPIIETASTNKLQLAYSIGHYLERLRPAERKAFILNHAPLLHQTFLPQHEVLILESAEALSIELKKMDIIGKQSPYHNIRSKYENVMVMLKTRATHPIAIRIAENYLFPKTYFTNLKYGMDILLKSRAGRDRLKQILPEVVSSYYAHHLSYRLRDGEIIFSTAQEQKEFIELLRDHVDKYHLPKNEVGDIKSRLDFALEYHMVQDPKAHPLAPTSEIETMLAELKSAGEVVDAAPGQFGNTAHIKPAQQNFIRCLLEKVRGKR